jgi:hypothetical protein
MMGKFYRGLNSHSLGRGFTQLIMNDCFYHIRPLLCFSLFCVRVLVGFEPRKLKNKQRKISFKNVFYGIFFNLNNNYKGLLMLSIKSTHYFIFHTLFSISFVNK